MPVLWLMHGIVCMDLAKSWLTTRPFSPLPPAAAGLGRVDVRMASLIDCCGIKQKPFLGKTGGVSPCPLQCWRNYNINQCSFCSCSPLPCLHSDSHFLHVPTAAALFIHTSSTCKIKCFSSILGYKASVPYAKNLFKLYNIRTVILDLSRGILHTSPIEMLLLLQGCYARWTLIHCKHMFNFPHVTTWACACVFCLQWWLR